MRVRIAFAIFFDQPGPFELGLPPLSIGLPKICQSYPQLQQPRAMRKALASCKKQLELRLSPLCHLWTWAGQACCSHPLSFLETSQLPLPPWCMHVEHIRFFGLHRKVLLFPHQRTDVLFKHLLNLTWIHFWSGLSRTFSLPIAPTSDQLFDQCFILHHAFHRQNKTCLVEVIANVKCITIQILNNKW